MNVLDAGQLACMVSVLGADCCACSVPAPRTPASSMAAAANPKRVDAPLAVDMVLLL
jgi:hypothetical protein